MVVLIDTAIIKQTIISKDYPEAIAKYSDRKVGEDNTVFDDYIYTFKDTKGRQQEIVVTISKRDIPKDEIKIKYNENNPQNYYGEDATMDKTELIWYIVKVITLILLIILFINKKLLSKINISGSLNKN